MAMARLRPPIGPARSCGVTVSRVPNRKTKLPDDSSKPSHPNSLDSSSMSPSDSSPPDSAYAEIVVIRHGETASNADGIIQGQLDIDLNDLGRQQAVAVADRLSQEPKIHAIYSSDLKRAYETAQIIATSCGGLEVNKDPDLRERNLGDLQGVPRHKLADLNPKAYQAFVSHRTDQLIPGGGESLDQLYERSTSAVERISSKHKGERVVVVTHGGVINSLRKRANPRGVLRGKVLNTSVNMFHVYDGGEWVTKVWCDVSHLERAGHLKSGSGSGADAR